VSRSLVNVRRVDESVPIADAHLLAGSGRRTMGYWKVKPNMHGTGGGRWGTREEAKRFANKVRRRDDAAEARVPEEEESYRGPRAGWLRLNRPERKALQAEQFGDVDE